MRCEEREGRDLYFSASPSPALLLLYHPQQLTAAVPHFKYSGRGRFGEGMGDQYLALDTALAVSDEEATMADHSPCLSLITPSPITKHMGWRRGNERCRIVNGSFGRQNVCARITSYLSIEITFVGESPDLITRHPRHHQYHRCLSPPQVQPVSTCTIDRVVCVCLSRRSRRM